MSEMAILPIWAMCWWPAGLGLLFAIVGAEKLNS